MALRIACDVDGTLADMNGALRREAAQLFDPSDASSPTPTMTPQQVRQFWAHVHGVENFWTTLPETEPGAVARLAAAAAQHGWEVLFLTRRFATAGDTSQLQTQRWLQAHGFELASVYVMDGSRGKVADALALDAVLDDRPDNCLDVVTHSKARALLVWRDDPASVPPELARVDIEVVLSMTQAVESLERMSVKAEKRARFMGRIRAIGT
jgi:hypothetical protein